MRGGLIAQREEMIVRAPGLDRRTVPRRWVPLSSGLKILMV